MPIRYVKEMFCDRVAAGKIYRGREYTDACPLSYFLRGNARQKMHPAQITALAKSGNRTALRAFHIFSEILGAACGNYALTYMATGGIYIGGGMIPKILPLIDKEAFENAYLNKGRFKDFLDNIPVYVILDETAPSIGAVRAISL